MMNAVALTENKHVARSKATRAALRHGAIELFEEQGFEATSVAEIAGRAGVTERTFYRHFPTKESVLFDDYEDRLDWLHQALERRPSGEPLIDSVLIAIHSYPDEVEIVRQAAALRRNLLRQDQAVAHLRLVQAAFAEEITEHARRRIGHGPDVDLYSAVAGATLAAALVSTLDTWAQRGSASTDELTTMVESAMAYLRAGLPTPGERQPAPPAVDVAPT
jgi:AcrR family transcriptional regulator